MSEDDEASPAAGGPYYVFRNPSYRRYMLGWWVALVGTRVQVVAIGWEVYARTGEPLALGWVGLVQALPNMVLALPSGYLADRINRRVLVTLSLTGMTTTSLLLALCSWLDGPLGLMYLLLGLDAVSVTVGRPARMALLPQIVSRELFSYAVMWNSSMFQIASVVGPAVGGFIVSVSVPAAYLVAAGGSLFFICLLSGVRTPSPVGRENAGPLRQLREGFQFLNRNRLLLTLMALDMFAVLLGGAVYLLPVFAKDILHVGARGFGWLQAAPALGAFIMALTLAHLPPMRHAGRNLLWAVAGFGVATIVFGLSRSFWLSMLMLFLTGAFDNVSMVVRHTLVQMLTPDSMRGRVSAVNAMFIGASNELGGLESGVVAHWLGPVLSVVTGGCGTLLVVVVTALSSPRLRCFGSLHGVEPETTEEEHEAEPR